MNKIIFCINKRLTQDTNPMEVIKGEIEEKLKDIDSATNPMWIRKQIISLFNIK